MPADHRLHKEWIKKQVDYVDKNPQELPPVLQQFQKLIETNPRLHMYFVAMFDEVPVKK
jgi:phosphatidylserine decarboxylase